MQACSSRGTIQDVGIGCGFKRGNWPERQILNSVTNLVHICQHCLLNGFVSLQGGVIGT